MNNKKILALVLAFAMIFSSMTTAFADTTATTSAAIGADAAALKTMGVLQGDNSTGVTPEYLAKETTRMQAAIMFLRLKGLEDEAMAFTGAANFADAGTMTWTQGKAIMAYLKANPQLGWVGADAGKFNPLETITVNQYYKVMLEALGYKQTTTEVVGDFSWSDVMTFAASKGLVKVADVTKFTNNDVAIATIEALKTNVKETTTTLATAMVDAGMINKDAAIAAGLYEASTTAKVEEVKVLGNNKVLVEFDSAVAKAFAENAANYKIVVNGTTTALEVKSAVLDGTKQVVLETAAQTAGTAYKMTVGTVSINFAGVSKSTEVPEIDTVKGTDTERVVLTFTTGMDLATALDKANYSIEGVTIESVNWEDDSDRDSVELVTKGLVTNRTYKVVVTNVKSIDGVVMKSDSMSFVAKADKKAPVVDTANDATFVDTNTRIIVTFVDDNEITKESAENVANYKLEVGNTTDTLEILSAKLVEDADDDMKVVELTTAAQKKNQKYELHVNNIVDTSVLANKMAKETTINLYGAEADTDAPELEGMTYVSSTIIEVEFSDDSRIDATSVLDINNYSIDNDIVVEKAELKDSDNAKNDIVRLTVSKLGADSRYELTVENIADEYGNTMAKPEDDQETFDKEDVNMVATIENVVTKSNTEIVVTFSKELDEASAEDVVNYAIDGNIGTPSEAKYNADAKTVTLTTEEMNGNTEYELTINGVKDIAGNVLVDVTADIVVASTDNDVDAPEVEDVEATASTIVVVTFSEPIDVDSNPTIEIDVDGNGSGANVTGVYAVSSNEDDTVLEFTVPAFGDDEDVLLVGTTATDVAGNKADVDTDGIEFSSTTEAADDIELDTWDQTDVYTFELQFSGKVELINPANDEVSDNGIDFTIEVDDDDKTLVTLTADDEMEVDEEYFLVLTDKLAGFHGETVVDSDEENNNAVTYLQAELEDEDAPFIDSVKAINRTTIEVKFNENMSTAGKWAISYEDEDGDTQSVSVSNTFGLKDNKVTITLASGKILESDNVYTLIVKEMPKDIAGNKMDAELNEEVYDFVGTDVVGIGNYVTGVKVVNGATFKVYTNEDVTTVTGVTYGTTNTGFSIKAIDAADQNESEFAVYSNTTDVTIGGTEYAIPTAVLAAGENYTVTVTGGLKYTFKGIVEDDIDIDKDGTDFFFDYEDIKAGDIVVVTEADGTRTGAIVDANKEAKISGIDGVSDIVVVRGSVVLFFLHTDLADVQ
ncbi:MAG TPA: Ig-like domain-containing protein [Clostridia bacterium]|nr:Ig-like domain-containing protein [Clostridia bacterium]